MPINKSIVLGLGILQQGVLLRLIPAELDHYYYYITIYVPIPISKITPIITTIIIHTFELV